MMLLLARSGRLHFNLHFDLISGSYLQVALASRWLEDFVRRTVGVVFLFSPPRESWNCE